MDKLSARGVFTITVMIILSGFAIVGIIENIFWNKLKIAFFSTNRTTNRATI